MTAVDQNHAIGLAAPLAEGLKQGQETSVTAAAQPAAAALVTVGGDRVANADHQWHRLLRTTLPHKLQQGFGIPGCRSDIEVLAEGSEAMTSLQMTIEQHEKTGFLE